MSLSISISKYNLPTIEKFPESTASWQLDPERAILLVHDMQRYFLSPFPETMRTNIIKNCSLVRQKCITEGIPVYYTAQPGDMSEKQRGLLKDIWGAGMSASPTEKEIVHELSPQKSDHVLTKWRYSAFHKSDLLASMRTQNRDQLMICGVYAHVGILATTIEAFSNDIETFLVADAIGDFSFEHHEMAINYAATRCAVLLGAKEVLS